MPGGAVLRRPRAHLLGATPPTSLRGTVARAGRTGRGVPRRARSAEPLRRAAPADRVVLDADPRAALAGRDWVRSLRGRQSTDRSSWVTSPRLPVGARASSLPRGQRADRAGHLMPRPLPATKIRPSAGWTTSRVTRSRSWRRRAAERCTSSTAATYRGVLRPLRRARRLAADPRRRSGRSCCVPGVGMWSFGPDAAEARIAGEFYVQRHQRDARRRVGVDVRSRSTTPRSSGWSTGSWRRRSSARRPPTPLCSGGSRS